MCFGNLFEMSSSVDDMHENENELSLEAETTFINRLSPEILAQIFLHCLPTHNWETQPSSLKTSEAPVVFGRVCSYWREVTYSTPALWSRVSVTIPRADADLKEQILDRLYKSLELQMSMSKSFPLDITIRSGNSSDGFWSREDVCKAYAIIIPHIRRWRNIRFDSDFPRSFLRQLFKSLATGAPLLENFKFTTIGGVVEDEDPPEALMADFSRTPLLREIKIGKDEILGITNIKGPQCMHRTIIDFFIESDLFLRVVKEFANTYYLECSVADDFNVPERIIQSPLTRNIRALNIELRDYSMSPQGDGTRIFDTIRLPLLEELAVDYGDPPNTLKFPVSKLIRRFGCSLTKLSLYTRKDLFTFEGDVLPILQLSPSLQELHLLGDIDTSVFDGLAGLSLNRKNLSEYSILCPELLSMRLSIPKRVPYEPLYSMCSFRGQLQALEDSGGRGNLKHCITLLGHMGDLPNHPDVLRCFRKYGVKCAFGRWDIGLPVYVRFVLHAFGLYMYMANNEYSDEYLNMLLEMA